MCCWLLCWWSTNPLKHNMPADASQIDRSANATNPQRLTIGVNDLSHSSSSVCNKYECRACNKTKKQNADTGVEKKKKTRFDGREEAGKDTPWQSPGKRRTKRKSRQPRSFVAAWTRTHKHTKHTPGGSTTSVDLCPRPQTLLQSCFAAKTHEFGGAPARVTKNDARDADTNNKMQTFTQPTDATTSIGPINR